MALDFQNEPQNLAGEITNAVRFVITPTIESWNVINGNPRLISSFKGHELTESERFKAWNEMEPFKTSTSAGVVIETKIEKGMALDNNDLLLIDYLSNWSPPLLSNKKMGETPDFDDDTKRRGRIVGMINTVEKEFLKKNPNPNEDDWTKFYDKFLKVFDSKINDPDYQEKAEWLKIYTIFYSTAWHHRDFGRFKDYDEGDPEGMKYRGMIRAIYNETKDVGNEALLTYLNILTKSTGIQITEADGKKSNVDSAIFSGLDEIRSL